MLIANTSYSKKCQLNVKVSLVLTFWGRLTYRRVCSTVSFIQYNITYSIVILRNRKAIQPLSGQRSVAGAVAVFTLWTPWAACSSLIHSTRPWPLSFSVSLTHSHALVYMPVFSVTQASFRLYCLIVFNSDIVELSRWAKRFLVFYFYRSLWCEDAVEVEVL